VRYTHLGDRVADNLNAVGRILDDNRRELDSAVYLPPFGTVQVVYQRGTAAFGERSTQGHTLFLKATTVF